MTQQSVQLKSSACPMSRLFGPPTAEPMPLAARISVFIYGLSAYASFLAAILYAIGFVANLLVPKSIDSGTPGELVPSLLFNTAILSVFVIQHTIMARPWFKRWWTRIIPVCIERSTFVLAASLSLGLAFWLWRPLPSILWNVNNRIAAAALTCLSLLGWALVLASSFMVSHWDLFGLRQVCFRLTNQEYRHIGFRIVGLYRLVRHPLMLGFIIAVWATPVMTVGHLFFAAMITAYIFLGTTLEERDLVAHFGDQYMSYRRRVPGIFPIPRPRSSDA